MSTINDLLGVALRRLGVLHEIDYVRTAHRQREELNGETAKLNARMAQRTEAALRKMHETEQRILG